MERIRECCRGKEGDKDMMRREEFGERKKKIKKRRKMSVREVVGGVDRESQRKRDRKDGGARRGMIGIGGTVRDGKGWGEENGK